MLPSSTVENYLKAIHQGQSALGPDQRWMRLSEPALRALAGPLGITEVRIDPRLSAPAPVLRP